MKSIDYLSSAINEQPTLLCKFNKLMELITKENYFVPQKRYYIEVRSVSFLDTNADEILLPAFSFFTNTLLEQNYTKVFDLLRKEYFGEKGATFILDDQQNAISQGFICQDNITRKLKAEINGNTYQLTNVGGCIIIVNDLYEGTKSVIEL